MSKAGKPPYQPPLVIGLHGTRGSGKDTLFSRLEEIHGQYGRVAFAQALKMDLRPFTLQHFDIDALTCEGADKELIRPMLIAYGMAQRARDPLYWCKRATDQIAVDWAARDADFVPVVTDVRFENEVHHLRRTFPRDSRHAGVVIVNVTRDGAPPPTEEEEKHYRDVAALADIHFHWGNDSWGEQCEKARKLHDDILRLFDYA